MPKPTYSFIDTVFEETLYAECDLLIVIGSFSYSYAIVRNEQIIVLEKFSITTNTESLLHVYDERSWLTKDFNRVVVAHITSTSTVVPTTHYNSNAKEILELLYDQDAEAIKAYCDDCNDNTLKVIYRTHNDIVRKMIGQYATADVYHLQTVMINQTQNLAESTLTLMAIDHTYVLQLHTAEKLMLSKTIVCDSNQSFLYNILAFCKMYQIDTNQVKVELGGWLMEQSPFYDEVQKYFSSVQLAKNTNLFWNENFIEPQYAVLYGYLYNAK